MSSGKFTLAFEDSNIAAMGSEEDASARKSAAESEEAWRGCGSKPGIQVWRIEQFKVVPWPEEQYGEFYEGDSYIVLKTTHDKASGKLLHDIFFWLGLKSTADEQGTAAYKTVELDDLFGGEPVQHREVEKHESASFQALFPELKYLVGGAASGFAHVEESAYAPRLLQVKKTGKLTRVFEVTCERASLNHGDAFVLDAGAKLYVWAGDTCSPFEKAAANLSAERTERARNGKSTTVDEIDAAFWTALGGEGPVKSAEEAGEVLPEVAAVGEGILLKLSDSTGDMTVAEVARGDLKLAMLDEDDVFICDMGAKVMVYCGSGTSVRERTNAMHTATKYLKFAGKSFETPIQVFSSIDAAKRDKQFAAIFD